MDTESQQPQTDTEPQATLQPMVTGGTVLSSPATASVPAEQAKPKKNHHTIIYALIGVFLIGLGLVGGWLLSENNSTETSQQSQTKTTISSDSNTPTEAEQSTAVLQPEDVTEKIKTALAAKYTLVDTSVSNNLKSNQVGVNAQKASPPYKATGYTFYNTYVGGSSLYLTSYSTTGMPLPTASEAAIRTDIAKVYTDSGLLKTGSYGSTANVNLTNIYSGKGLVCIVDDTTTPTSPTNASCGLISAYQKAAAALKPFADVLSAVTSGTVLNAPSIKDSKVAGYQTASVGSGDIEGIGGHVELFYRNTSGDWKYFTGTQSELGCEKYNTTDLKNAYMGEACWDTTTNKDSTVK